MADTISMHIQLSAQEHERIRPHLHRIRRDRRIRREYKQLLPEMGQLQAFWELAERHDLSSGQVKRIVYDID